MCAEPLRDYHRMYPSSLGSQYMRCKVTLPDQVKCFPEYLRAAGYYCTNNVKTDYNFDVPPNAWDEVSRKAHWKNRPADKPFFAVFNFETTHESRVRMRGAEYDKVTDRLSPSERRDPAKAVMPPYYPDTPEARKDWVQYYELITTMDKQAGDLLNELEGGWAPRRHDRILLGRPRRRAAAREALAVSMQHACSAGHSNSREVPDEGPGSAGHGRRSACQLYRSCSNDAESCGRPVAGASSRPRVSRTEFVGSATIRLRRARSDGRNL